MIGVDVSQQTVVGEDMVSGVLITSKFCLCEEPKATNPTQCLDSSIWRLPPTTLRSRLKARDDMQSDFINALLGKDGTALESLMWKQLSSTNYSLESFFTGGNLYHSDPTNNRLSLLQ